jgi:hypothetical protein
LRQRLMSKYFQRLQQGILKELILSYFNNNSDYQYFRNMKSLISTDLTNMWFDYDYHLTWGFATLTKSWGLATSELATCNIEPCDLWHRELQLARD